LTDHELLDRLRLGDASAFDALFRAHYAELVTSAERLVGERTVAEDVAQEVMLELWRRRGSLVVQESVRAYLFRAVRNRALNQLRHERMKQRTAPLLRDPPSRPADAPGLVDEAEIAAALNLHGARGIEVDRLLVVGELSRQLL